MFIIFTRNGSKAWYRGSELVPEAHGVPNGGIKQEFSGVNRVRSDDIKDALLQLGMLMRTNALGAPSAGELRNNDLKACLKARFSTKEGK